MLTKVPYAPPKHASTNFAECGIALHMGMVCWYVSLVSDVKKSKTDKSTGWTARYALRMQRRILRASTCDSLKLRRRRVNRAYPGIYHNWQES